MALVRAAYCWNAAASKLMASYRTLLNLRIQLQANMLLLKN